MEITKNIKIDINELYLLEGNLLSGINHKAVKEYFNKNSHRSKTSEYREGSDNYNKAIEEDKKIAALPDHDIKDLYYDLIITSKSYEKVEFSIMQHKYMTHVYDDFDNLYEVEVVKYFLTDNSYHGFRVFGEVSELLNDRDVKELLFKSQKYDNEQQWYQKLQEKGEGYTLLHKKVMDAIHSFKDVSFYREYTDKNYNQYKDCVIIDKDLYLLSELNTILEFKKNDNKLYDEDDKVVSIYSWDDYIDMYKKYHK